MCAIFGWVKHKGYLSEREIAFSREALKSMKHRGPDAEDEFIENHIYLGHNRLSIIDLSEEANQPFFDESERFVIIYNGEVYNYLELRKEMEKQGICFNTKSDTEVVLKLFIQLNQQGVLKFDGMFAFAVYDRKEKKTYLYRDYLGQKPLYYFQYDEGLIFCSELRALLEIDQFKWVIDKENFYKYLMNACYMGDTTPLKGVKKLLPGHFIEIKDNQVSIKKYWDSIPGDDVLDISPQDALDEFGRMFDLSCEESMRADVPYGVFLSGGIDSSLILKSCHKINSDIKAYTVAMVEKDFDESDKSRLIADHLKISRNKVSTMNESRIQESIISYLSFVDEPHGDPGLVNAYFLAKSCRQEISVAIAGDGADELFAGYLPFKILSFGGIFKHLSDRVVSSTQKILEYCIPCSDQYMGLQFKMLSFLNGFPSHESLHLPLWLGALSVDELQKLCKSKNKVFFSKKGESSTLFSDVRERLELVQNRSHLNLSLYYYQKYFLPEYVCMHTDRAAMQNSLEVRSPFLSRNLIEFANRLPNKFKINKGELKKILKNYMKREDFPKSIYNQKKHGFTFPVSRWLKSVLKNSLLDSLHRENRIFELVNYSYVEFLLEQHFSNKRNNYRILYNLFVFSKWLEKNSRVVID